MLVLTRNCRDSFFIGEDIKITILRINSLYQIRVGIQAPREMKIIRDDIINVLPQDIPQEIKEMRKEIPQYGYRRNRS